MFEFVPITIVNNNILFFKHFTFLYIGYKPSPKWFIEPSSCSGLGFISAVKTWALILWWNTLLQHVRCANYSSNNNDDLITGFMRLHKMLLYLYTILIMVIRVDDTLPVLGHFWSHPKIDLYFILSPSI